ncbi:translocation/assembly module TamB domain-containing protein [Mesorhizobium tianshanense]|uniref:Uncharacterized protein n=1 Tax=Mesorhizobium tianshanense TaxID=39844 RepID=A0A562P9I4_9HYPH|nr:hypothetical protein [Mesorhizobium tianshanense]TWI41078.1 hypothetical protein IQ26_01014 [Mesorhizobium tianshanense]
MLRMLCAGLFCLVASASSAAGLLIGPFCIDGTSTRLDTTETTFTVDGKWTRAVLKRAPKKGTQKPMLVVFKGVPTPAPFLESCQQIVERETAVGNSPLLAGRIEQIEIDGHAFESNAGTSRFQVEPGRFSAKLGHVLQYDLPVLGGTTQLAGAKLWIKNTETILAEAGKLTGEFEIEAWNRTIDGARINFEGVELTGLNFAPKRPNRDNVAFHFDLDGGTTTLWQGRLVANQSGSFASYALSISGLDLKGVAATFKRVELSAREGVLSVSLKSVDGHVDEALQSNAISTVSFRDASFALGDLSANGEQLPLGLVATNPTMRDLSFDAAQGLIAGPAGASVIEGASQGTVAELTPGQFSSSIHFSNPSSAVLSLLGGSDLSDSVDLRLSRHVDDLTLGGVIATSTLALGKLDVEEPLKLTLNDITASLADVAATLEFPIDIDAKASEGKVNFHTEDYKVGLTGKFEGLRLKGLLRIPLADLESSHLFVKAKDFFLGLGLAAFLEPMIAGVKPTLSETTLRFSNPTDLKVGRISEGRIFTSVGQMVVGEPILRIGENGKKAKATLALTTEAGADLLYDLERGRLLIARGKLVADDVRFHFIEPGGEIDINGTRVTEPDITLKHLGVEFVGTDDLDFGTAELVGFKAQGHRVYKPADPEKPSDVTFDARLTTPLSVADANALKVGYKDVLSLEALQVRGFEVGMSSGQIDFGGDIRVGNAAVSISSRQVNRVKVNDIEAVILDDARFNASGILNAGLANAPSFRIDLNASGPTDRLNGSGSASVSPFAGGRTFDAEIAFKCEDGSRLKVPSEINLAVAGVNFDVSVKDGDFSGSGQTNPLAVAFHTTSGRDCDSPLEKWIIVPEESGWTWGICDFPPRKCKWKWTTPEINFKYKIKLAVRFAAVTLFMTNPVVNLNNGKVRYCNRGYASFGPTVFVGGYSPQIVTNYPGADAIVNAIIAGSFELAQTVAGTALINSVLTTVTDIINVGQVVCYD